MERTSILPLAGGSNFLNSLARILALSLRLRNISSAIPVVPVAVTVPLFEEREDTCACLASTVAAFVKRNGTIPSWDKTREVDDEDRGV